MSRQLVAVASLRRAIAAANASGDPDLLWLADRLGRGVRGETKSFDEALGLAASQSQRSWRTMANMSERDRLIAQIAARFPGKPNQKAIMVAKLLRRYASNGWIIDQHKAEMPSQYRGTVKELVYAAFRLGTVPTGRRRVFDIIKDCNEHPDLAAHESP